jgi:large subunit ribosomal protein L5
MNIGLKVTLRGERMWAFLDKLINVTLPARARLPRHQRQRLRRPRQLQPGPARAAGVPGDQLRPGRCHARHGHHHRHHRAATDEEARSLLELLGMPFRK